MANVNSFLRNYSIFLIALFYLLFLIWEYSSRNDEGREENLQILKEIGVHESRIDSIILGGSNALFGLSASQLSDLTKDKWVNFSLLNEGYSDEDYMNFVSSVLDDDSRRGILRVVYSSITPFRKGRTDARGSNKYNVVGARAFNFVPNRSLASYFKLWLNPGEGSPNKYYIDSRFGDFKFEDFDCRPDEAESISFSFERERTVALKEWAVRQLEALLWLFPAADIYLTLPSEFYGNTFLPNESERMVVALRGIADRLGSLADRRIILIEQPQFESLSYLCDKAHHANEKGRKWRTKNLAGYILPLAQ
jgi:hypothetical protein